MMTKEQAKAAILGGIELIKEAGRLACGSFVRDAGGMWVAHNDLNTTADKSVCWCGEGAIILAARRLGMQDTHSGDFHNFGIDGQALWRISDRASDIDPTNIAPVIAYLEEKAAAL